MDDRTNKKEKQGQQVVNQYAMILNYNAHVEHQNNYYGVTSEQPHAEEDPTAATEEDATAAKPCGQRGRPKKANKKILKSFIYHANDKEDANLRLEKLYKGLLVLKWIADGTNMKDFLSIFSGRDTTCRIIWTGEVNTLTELFKELISRKHLVQLPQGESIWVMVNARFWDKVGNQEFGNDRLRSTSTPISSKETIDWLVRVMNPAIPLDSIKEEMMTQH